MYSVRQHLKALIVACAVSTVVPLLSATPQVVISQVFGGGGNSGSPLKNDFIELFNQGQAPVPIEGWTIQYASASGSSWQSAGLSGIILPHQWFLICLPGGTSGGDPLPAADDSGSFAMSASSGKVALLDSAVHLSGSCPTSSHIVDFLGWGSASCFKGSGPAPGTSNTTAAVRKDSGMASGGDNAADYDAAPPFPRNSANAPLSVQLATLEAVTLKGGGVKLSWTTYSELNNFGFVVFRRMATDPAFVELSESFQQGFGTTIERHDYVYIDSTGNSACRYQLKQIDLDGNFRFTDSISVSSTSTVAASRTCGVFRLGNSPNPFNPTTTVICTVPGSTGGRVAVHLRVFDLLGRLIEDLLNDELPPGTHAFRFDGSRHSSGIYICRMEATINGKIIQQSTPMVLLK